MVSVFVKGTKLRIKEMRINWFLADLIYNQWNCDKQSDCPQQMLELKINTVSYYPTPPGKDDEKKTLSLIILNTQHVWNKSVWQTFFKKE